MTSKDALPRRNLVLTVLLFAMLYTFFYVFSLHVLPSVFPDNPLTVQAEFCLSIVIALIITLVLKRSFALNIAYKFSLVAAILIVLLLATPFPLLNLVFVFIIGAFFGVAQVAFLASFWRNYGLNDERGKISGIIVFFSLPIYFLISNLLAPDLGSFGIVILLFGLLGLISLLAFKISKSPIDKDDSKGNYPEKRTILLYLLPWLIFSIINATLSRNISLYTLQITSTEFYLTLAILQIIGSLIGALTGGIIADHLGRRAALAISITLSGISMALSGMALPGFLALNEAALYFANAASGLGWGVLLTLYVFVIWGDLSNAKNVTSMYAIGLITFYATAGIGYLATPIDQIPPITSALIGCLIIFMLNLPIALAPELAYFDVREKKKMKKYMRKIKQVEESMENHNG